jgi:cysteinyl-tRNA synthetase
VEAGGPLAPELVAALDEDFSTPAALAVMHELRTSGRLAELRAALELFGLGSLAAADEAPADVVALAEGRQAARAAKDFAEADRLRAAIDAAGWEVRDVQGGFQLVRRR